MKIQQILLAGATTVMLLTTSPVWAAPRGEKGPNPNAPGQVKARAQAPEIDAATGTSAIALLTGALLLAGERSRSRRS